MHPCLVSSCRLSGFSLLAGDRRSLLRLLPSYLLARRLYQMKSESLFLTTTILALFGHALASEQNFFGPRLSPNVGHGHLSEWSRKTKEAFLQDLRNNAASNWTMVIGNEGGGAA